MAELETYAIDERVEYRSGGRWLPATVIGFAGNGRRVGNALPGAITWTLYVDDWPFPVEVLAGPLLRKASTDG
jgi:hypothetical protein